jgi:hypothetical protein
LNAKADERKEERIAEVCQVYEAAPHQTDEITFSVDEATGIQALERIAADLPMAPGKPVAREFEYKRHGTQTLIAAMRIATGEVSAHCGDTRTEEDYTRFIEDLIQRHPGFYEASRVNLFFQFGRFISLVQSPNAGSRGQGPLEASARRCLTNDVRLERAPPLGVRQRLADATRMPWEKRDCLGTRCVGPKGL